VARPLLQPIATFPVDLEKVQRLEGDKPWLWDGHYQGSIVYLVKETDYDGLDVTTFTVDGDYSIEIRAVPR
jgi:hypothetical protein